MIHLGKEKGAQIREKQKKNSGEKKRNKNTNTIFTNSLRMFSVVQILHNILIFIINKVDKTDLILGAIHCHHG